MTDRDKQREELGRRVKDGGAIAEWAKRHLIMLGLIGEPEKPPEPPILEPKPEPAPVKDPAPVTKEGAHGNCHDCGAPINDKRKRQPFHRGEDREHVIYTCLPCANTRWNAIHANPLKR